MIRHALRAALAAMLLIGAPQAAFASPVKMSGSGICHCPGGTYYEKTSAANAFPSIEACLAQGGRHPQRGQGQCQAATMSTAAVRTPAPAPQSGGAYDRDLFGGWADADGDCQNTRHEVLAALSTGPVSYSRDGCYVVHGRWNDPYTGGIYSTARDLDVDHLVPLAYAWSRGADRWDREKRVRFANDPVNLFAVQASANRQKGAKGPLEWLPPNAGFHCQYLLRFTRVAKSYGLVFSANEARGIDHVTAQACGRGTG